MTSMLSLANCAYVRVRGDVQVDIHFDKVENDA
jgi:hypothetical protein